MPTVFQQPIDVQWQSFPVIGTTTYPSINAAIAAATILSAGNANAAVQIIFLTEVIACGVGASNVSGASVPTDNYYPNIAWAIQLANAGTVYPKATMVTAAIATSLANAGASYYIGYVTPYVITAP